MGKNIFEVTAKFDEDIARLSLCDRDALIEAGELFILDRITLHFAVIPGEKMKVLGDR